MTLEAIRQLYTFKERRFQTFNHNVRVFIFGAEVTPWLKGSLSVTWSNRESWNTVSFDLSNPRKIWQITRDNLNGKFVGGGEYSEGAKAAIFNYKNDPEINPFFELDIKTGIYGSQKSETSQQKASSIAAKNPFLTPGPLQERRYRLALNDCIFNKHDWMRVFVVNPYSGSNTEWMEVFCGFVEQHPISTNYLTGESTVRISGSCIKRQMSKMRVQTNIHEAVLDPAPLFEEGFYSDFIRPGQHTHPFAVASLEQTIRELVLGAIVAEDPDKPTSAVINTNGVGNFQLGNIVCYDPAAPGNILERWHLMTLFGVNKVPFPVGGGKDNLWLTEQEMRAIGEATVPRQNLPVGGPSGRYLHMLLPKNGTGPGSLINHSVSTDRSQEREWTTRWDVIREFASALDFQVLTSPSGDLLVEFPQYSFTPCAYASKDFKSCETTENTLGNMFVVDLHQKEETLDDESEDFPTMLTVGGGNAFQQQNAEVPSTVSPRAYIFSPALISRYGIISEKADFPFAGQKSEDAAQDTESNLTKRLAQLGLIEFQKRMANASTWSGSLVYRPFLFPNRPLELKRAERVGLIQSVTNTWNFFQNAETSVNINMLMAKREDNSYRLLTGAVNTPIDYAGIWGAEETKQSGSGVEVKTGQVQSGGNTKAKAHTGDNKGNRPIIPQLRDLSKLFPPFRKRIEQLLQRANLMNMSAFIGETYRSPARQNEVLSKGYSKAEAFLSYHQYGLAADIYLEGANGTKSISQDFDDYLALATLNTELGLGLVWGGGWTSPKDGPHFQIPASWGMTAKKARIIRQRNINAGKSEDQAIEQVWNAIYAANPSLVSSDSVSGTIDPETAEVLTEFETSTAGKETPAVIPPAKPCTDQYLTAPGYKKK